MYCISLLKGLRPFLLVLQVPLLAVDVGLVTKKLGAVAQTLRAMFDRVSDEGAGSTGEGYDLRGITRHPSILGVSKVVLRASQVRS